MDMKIKTIARLAIIATALLVFGVGAWIGTNALVASRLRLVDMVEVGDLDGVHYICRWDSSQLNAPAPVSIVYETRFPTYPGVKRSAVNLWELHTPLCLSIKRGHPRIRQELVILSCVAMGCSFRMLVSAGDVPARRNQQNSLKAPVLTSLFSF